jgi:hypothetical protein
MGNAEGGIKRRGGVGDRGMGRLEFAMRLIPSIHNIVWRLFSVYYYLSWVLPRVVKILISRLLIFILFLFLLMNVRFQVSVFRICYCVYLS